MANNPSPSLLDSDQILGRVMDEANDRLRVTTEATVVNGAVEVAIDADSGDTIAIKDPVTGFVLHINSDGSINTTSSTTVAADVNMHDGSGNPITSTGGALNVNTTGSSTVTGTVTTEQVGLNAFQTSDYTVGTSVQQLTIIPLAGRSSVSFRVDRDNVGVIRILETPTASGWPLYAGDTLGLDLTDNKTVYAKADQAGQIISVIELG